MTDATTPEQPRTAAGQAEVERQSRFYLWHPIDGRRDDLVKAILAIEAEAHKEGIDDARLALGEKPLFPPAVASEGLLRDLDTIISQLRENGYADWPDWLTRIRAALAKPVASEGLDVDSLARAEHFWCVAVEGEAALSHEWERHRPQATEVLYRLRAALVSDAGSVGANTMDPYCGCESEGHDGPCAIEAQARPAVASDGLRAAHLRDDKCWAHHDPICTRCPRYWLHSDAALASDATQAAVALLTQFIREYGGQDSARLTDALTIACSHGVPGGLREALTDLLQGVEDGAPTHRSMEQARAALASSVEALDVERPADYGYCIHGVNPDRDCPRCGEGIAADAERQGES